MKIHPLLLLFSLVMTAAAAEKPSDADLRECLRPALHPAMTAEALQKILEAATGPDGKTHLRTAYGTNTLSAALLAGDQDVRVLHAMDFKRGTFSSTNLLQSLRHPSEEADIQYLDCFYSEGKDVANGLVSLERTNTYRAICLFVATRTGGQGPWTLEFFGLANRSSPELVYAYPVYARDDTWACFSRPGNWEERRERLAKTGLSERAIRPGVSTGEYLQYSRLRSILLEKIRHPFFLDYRQNENVPAESWAQKMSRLEKDLARASGQNVSFFLSPDLASEVVPPDNLERRLGGNMYRISLYDALNLMCEVHPLRYELTEYGVYLSFDPGRERNPEPEPDPEAEAAWKALGFGAENSFPVAPGP